MLQSSAYGSFLTPEVGITVLEYEGICSHENVVHLSTKLEQALAPSAGGRFKKVFGIFVELVQNIKLYSLERSASRSPEHHNDGIGIIRVSEESRCYTVTAGNCMSAEAYERVKVKCEAIKNTPKEELRLLYNEHLKRSQEVTSKGGGVGFIDIALKANGNWEYEFHLLEENRVFFVITAYIAKGKFMEEEPKSA